MAKTFTVEIGGKVRALRFHQRDAIELKKRFGQTPHTLLFLRCLGLDFENAEPGKPPRMNPGFFDPEVQFAVFHKAILRGGWNVTEDKLIDAVDEAVQTSDGKVSLGDFVAQAVYCAFYSGAITGSQVDLQAGPQEDEAPTEGNAPASGNP